VRAVPRLCEFYPRVCLTSEEKARKNLSQGKKNLSQSTVYILPKQPHVTKPSQTHTLQNPHIHIHTHTHTRALENPPTHTHITKQYKTTTVHIKFSPCGLIKSTALTLCVLDVPDLFQIGVFGQEHFY